MSEGVDGRVVIITGGAGGIGRGLAAYLGGRGALVAITDWEQDKLDAAMDGLRAAGVGTAIGLRCDVRDRAAVQEMVDLVHDRFGRVEAIVNNAQAFGVPRALTTLTEEEFDLVHASGV